MPSFYTPEQVSGLAATIYQEINSPVSQSVSFISGWLTQTQSLGQLNNKLSTYFFPSGGGIAWDFGMDEEAVYTLIYKSNYYESQSLAMLTGGGVNWTNMKEGDTSITRESVAKMSKAFLDLNTQSNTFLRLAVNDYKRKKTLVQCVDAQNSYSVPTP